MSTSCMVLWHALPVHMPILICGFAMTTPSLENTEQAAYEVCLNAFTGYPGKH